jgi:glutamate-1-semialdehyde 2,1-aminomutase
VATLRTLNAPGTYDLLARQGTRLMRGVADAFAEAGVAASVNGFPEIFHVAFGLNAPPENYRDILSTDRAGYVRVTTGLLARGVRVLERGAWFISSAHDDAVVDETISALRDTLAAL